MTLIVHDMEQGGPEWFAARAGKPTASMFSTVMAKGEGKTRRAYLLKLAGEILTGEPMETFTNGHMERGHDQEGDARDRYALMYDATPVTVGFVEDTDLGAGCSPDALLGDNGVLEIKSALPHIQIDRLLAGKIPSEHVAQCQGNLLVTGRDFVDFTSHCPRLPLFVKRAYRDEPYIKNLASEIERFNDELAVTVDRVRRYGRPPAEVVKAALVKSLADENILMAG